MVEISKEMSISVVTKGNASQWFTKLGPEIAWESVIKIDNGNLCIFKSASV